jgi:ferric-chelate reductase (NADPH)
VTEEGINWGEGVRPATRDYTPLYDAERHELAYDFFIHDGGIASSWALAANVGDKLVIGGPRGSLVVPEDYAWQLYVCDESGMPALRRRLLGLSRLPVRPQVTALVTIGDASYQDYLADLQGFNIEWIVGHHSSVVAERLAQVSVPAEDYFIWVTGEGAVVKSLLGGLKMMKLTRSWCVPRPTGTVNSLMPGYGVSALPGIAAILFCRPAQRRVAGIFRCGGRRLSVVPPAF